MHARKTKMEPRRSFGILLLATGLVLWNRPLAHAQSALVHSRVMALLAGMSGHSTQSYLGIELRNVSDDQVATLKLKEARGVEITGMDHDGPACKGGLQLHDVILQMNGQNIENQDQLRRVLREIPAGRQVTLLVSRDGQQRTLQIQTANREEVEREAWEKHYTVPEPSGSSSAFLSHSGSSFLSPSHSPVPKGTHSFLGTSMLVSSSYTGARLEVMGPQLAEFFGAQDSAGLLVRSVEPNSPAADAGMRAGDVVIRINSLPVVSGSDWSKIIHENRGKTVNVVVLRDKKEQTLTLTPDSRKRSSCEPWNGFHGWFGNPGPTRQAIEELEPMLRAIAAAMQRQIEQVRATPEMTQMVAKLTAWSNTPELQHRMEIARRQLVMAAEAARLRMDSPEFRDRMNALHHQMRSVMRLD